MRSHVLSVLLITAGVVSLPSSAKAQLPASAYAFAGPVAVTTGNRSAALTAGGGGDLGLGGGISVGGELGVVHLPASERRTDCCVSTSPAASGPTFSFRLSRHFGLADRHNKWQPFVRGGLSGVSGLGTLDIGGGADRWISPHAGLRLEVREQFPAFLAFRVGIVFR